MTPAAYSTSAASHTHPYVLTRHIICCALQEADKARQGVWWECWQHTAAGCAAGCCAGWPIQGRELSGMRAAYCSSVQPWDAAATLGDTGGPAWL